MHDELTDRVIAIIAKSTKRDPAEITPESTFEEMGLDSMEVVCIANDLEEAFNVAIPNEEAFRITDVRQAVACLQALLAEQVSDNERMN